MPTSLSLRRSATRVTSSSVEGRMRPCTASTRPASRMARSKLPVTAARAVIKRFPKLWPLRPCPWPKRYWKSWVMSASSSARAAMQLRKSPGGNTPSSRRRRPDEPPSSATVTIAVRWGVCLFRPRSKAESPVPPPMATTFGASLSCSPLPVARTMVHPNEDYSPSLPLRQCSGSVSPPMSGAGTSRSSLYPHRHWPSRLNDATIGPPWKGLGWGWLGHCRARSPGRADEHRRSEAVQGGWGTWRRR